MSGISKINELKDGDKGINLMATIESKEEIRVVNTKFGERKVCTCKVKDDSGSIKYTLWGKDTDKAIGDAIMIENGYINSWNDEIQLNKGSKKQ
ncbi:MAG: DNA-binding protein [Acidobacteria bacterium]|jgi:ssDNA-binding replication factor A large subunit|nr:DNA-binding protein [Acidobacteriota bacterium]|tara:strand:- start:745 stop:1026 length:282 start_codon:yes stop_codon:yes gene_type:complete